VERYAMRYGVAVVMPELWRSFVCDMAYGRALFSYLTEELPTQLSQQFGLDTSPERSFLAGQSVGGYGAMKCALTYPERYAGAAAFSAPLDLPAALPLLREAAINEGN
jgi:S-formylglutathione hydrolase FrmB